MRIFALSFAALMLLITTLMAAGEPEKVVLSAKSTSAANPLPTLVGQSQPPALTAQSVMAVDVASGTLLYEKNSDKPHSPASITKVMTALVALEEFELGDVLTANGQKVDGHVLRLVNGEELTLEDLLYGILIYSANDAAEVVAQNFDGGRSAFIDAMNEKARKIGLKNTHFVNPSGLDELGNITTAQDMIRLAEHAMQNKTFAEIVATKEKTIVSLSGEQKHRLTNINELLGKVDGVLGIKTGFTVEAKENLISLTERNGHRTIIALFGSEDRFGESEELIEWIFDNYEWKVINMPSSNL